MFATLAGGGLRMGQVVGKSPAKGEFLVPSAFHAQDLLAMRYHVLGVDLRLQFADNGGTARADHQRWPSDR